MIHYRVLVLTDHRSHSKENSLYALLNRMSTHDACSGVDVASRGNPRNSTFFKNVGTTVLEAIQVNEEFAFDATGDQFIEETSNVDLLDYDIIFMRLPRPVRDSFLTKLNDLTSDKIVINNPLGIITCSSKAFLLNFPDLCPPIRLCNTIEDVMDFASTQDIVLKPLYEYGGKGLLKISGNTINDSNRDWPLQDYLPRIQKELESNGYLAMKFLKNVTNGDKRIIVVNGEILASSNRLPPADSWLCNVARGGTSVISVPTQEEIAIVEKIDPILIDHGILIYGVDTLEDDDGKRVLSEINTLSIGGFPQAELQTGRPIIQMTLDKIFEYADEQYDT